MLRARHHIGWLVLLALIAAGLTPARASETDGVDERRARAAARANDPHWCGGSTGPLPNVKRTAHFVIWYDTIKGGLTIGQFASVLENVWTVEVANFGWAAPPSYTSNPAPGGRYPVRLVDEGGDYGSVSPNGAHAGMVGDNPWTGWNEGDAQASCMILDDGFDNVGSGNNLDDLKVTAAHEFFHSITRGLGVTNDLDRSYREGGASWMEDEVYDSINDNYQYLWPKWDSSMGAHPDDPKGLAYNYWLVWRGLTERYGSGVPGGAEALIQRILENVSKGQKQLPATEKAFWDLKHTYFFYAYHQFAVAALFMKPCNGNYPPLCFEEADGYRGQMGGPPTHHGAVTRTQPYTGSIRDDYTLNWIKLPDTPKSYPVAFKNLSTSSPMFWSVACDLGNEIRLEMWGPVEPGGKRGMLWVKRKGCDGSSYAIVTNHHRSGGNPTSSPLASYKIWVAQIPMTGSLTWTVSGNASGTSSGYTWTDTWNETGTLSIKVKRGPVSMPEWYLVDNGSSYTIDYTQDRTVTSTQNGCTTAYERLGTGSGAPVAIFAYPGVIGQTYPNLDPPIPYDEFPDPLDLYFYAPLAYSETWEGCSNGSANGTGNGPYYHGLDTLPACIPASLDGAASIWWQPGAPFSAGWKESNKIFEFDCSATVPVTGGNQTITVSGSVGYDIAI